MTAASLLEAEERDLALIHEALRFFVWAAGEGLSPGAGEDANEPEEVLFQYSLATGDEDWEALPGKITDALRARAQKEQKESGDAAP